ncbi:MAG: hypothetical protein KDB95_16245, partial [Flavobacteriales bacterium]|nr:hypothetical protein [Flavobacteriales bacterium]
MRGKIEQRKDLLEEGGVLAVEGAPSAVRQSHRLDAGLKGEGQGEQHPVDRVDVRVVIGEALLDRALDGG